MPAAAPATPRAGEWAPPSVRLGDRARLTPATEAVALPMYAAADGVMLDDLAGGLGSTLGVDLAAYAARDEAKGEPGEIVAVPVVGSQPVRTVILYGVGDGAPATLRKAAAALGRRAKDSASLTVALPADTAGDGIRAFVESLLLAGYTFSVRSEPKPAKLTDVSVLVTRPARADADLDRALATARAAGLARTLTNTPSLDKDPAWLTARAEEVARESGLGIHVRDESALASEGFGGILAVGMGSTRPPRLVELTHAPAGARRHVVLVGKGITFDSGGLSIKSTDGMVTMKTDMGGSAAVLATLQAVAALGLRVRVTGLMCIAENMPSGSAQRPGDVITHYGGRTVEVLNTDAEGRLVMADALAYADRHLDPDVLIDVATLTGAASLGLGKRHGALFTADDTLADQLVDAAAAGGERLWRMPLVDEYRPALDSPVADIRNVADPSFHFSGGAIAAALFLREFVGTRRWAHLDIAGPARADKDEGDVTKGATGFGARTLVRFLEGVSARR